MKNKFRTWFCRKCGKEEKLEQEEDEKTIKMWCPGCNVQMRRVKDDKNI